MVAAPITGLLLICKMNDIQLYKNEQFGEVRVAGTSEEPLFCLTDICRVLDLHVGMTKQRLDQKGVSLIDTLTNGGIQQLVYINEKNLYKVIMRSDKPQAEPFQDWVCGEVLPSIRKTGSYSIQKLSRKELAQMVIEAEEEKERLQLEVKKREDKIEQDKPKVLFADAVCTSKRSCLVAELAKILQQNGVNIGQNRLFKWLRSNGYLCQKGQYYNQPTQKAMELGLFEIKKTSINKPDGSVLVKSTTKVTGRGQVYFVNKFLNVT